MTFMKALSLKLMAPVAAVLALSGGAFLYAANLIGDEPKTTKPLDSREFMVQKRAYSQIALDGLMREEYQTIIVAGENMRKMRADKRWPRLASDDYKRFSEDFEKSAQAMVDAARRKNLDGCMTAYVNCLQACYSCHKYVRAFPVPASLR